MSRVEFDDTCSGCKPVLINAKTGQVESDASVTMQTVKAYWATTTLEQRRAFHRVTCLNSSDFRDLSTVKELVQGMQTALEKM